MPAANTRKLTITGILLALTMVLLYLHTIIPTNKLTVLMFVSFILGIVLIETSPKYALLFYISSVLLTLIFPVNKLSLLLYYTFFGIYGYIKYYLEKPSKIIFQYLLKFIYFITVCLLNYFIARAFLPNIINEISIYLIFIIAIIVFFLYDYLYSIAMDIYVKRILKRRM